MKCVGMQSFVKCTLLGLVYLYQSDDHLIWELNDKGMALRATKQNQIKDVLKLLNYSKVRDWISAPQRADSANTHTRHTFNLSISIC